MNAVANAATPSAGHLVKAETAAALIRAGRTLMVSGDEHLLRKLPYGHWIGGTIPYFMGQLGGQTTRDRVFVTEVATHGLRPVIRHYDLAALPQLCVDAPANGYTLVIIPAFTETHSSFARNAPSYEEMYMKPLAGWVAGIHLDDLGSAKPLVFNGLDGHEFDDAAIVMHVPLPAPKYAHVDIINLFSQGDGERIRFLDNGFSVENCLIEGRPCNFADYALERNLDVRLPLVADYCGASINVAIKGIDAQTRRVDFYAPVFSDVEYRFANALPDYVQAFRAALPQRVGAVSFACNCVLNYLYCELEGKRVEKMLGPMTFGEVAYQLLNQTLVYVTVEG